jgi:hypothetical protein
MLHRLLVALAAVVLTAALAAAEDAAKKETCPTFGFDEIVALINKAPSCQRAVAIFELCEFGASGDVGLGAEVTKKCEGDFLRKLSAAQKRAYDGKQKQCARKYENKSGTTYRSFEAFCGAYVARDYSAKYSKATASGRK